MNSATLTHHLHGIDAPICMFHTDYIIWEYLYFIWISLFEGRHFTLYIYIFIDLFKAKIYMQFHVQVHRDRDGYKRVLFALFYKSTKFRCHCECTQINVESLHIWNMYYFYLYEQKFWMFKEQVSAPAPQSVLQWALLSTPHKHFHSAHFSGLTLDWAAM